MNTTKSDTQPKTSTTSKPAKDAIAMLKEDHAAASQFYAEVEEARSVGRKKDMTAQPGGVEPDVEKHDARIKVLPEYVNRHVEEAHDKMVRKVTPTTVDMVDLGERMAARNDELLAQAA